MASDLTTLAYAIKRVYKDGVPENLASKGRVFRDRVRKEGDFVGNAFYFAAQYGNNQGVSSTFATGQANVGSTKGVQFALTRKQKYGFAVINAETMRAMQNDMGAFVRSLTSEVDSTIDEMGNRDAIELYEDGSGSIGKVSAVSSGVITLAVLDDAKHFSVGQKITANPTKSGTAGNMRSGTGTVSVVDEDLGKVTYTGTITSIAANDYLYNEGDYDAGMAGLSAWIPETAPTSGDSHFGVDRSVHVDRLAGSRVTDTSLPEEEALQLLAVNIQKRGGKPDEGFLNPVIWDRIQKRLGSKIEYTGGGTATAGFQYIVLATPAGMIKLFPDPACPLLYGWLLQMNTWAVKHLDGFPHIVMDDTLRSLRQSTADGVEIRVRRWGNLYTVAPGKNGICKFAA